MTFRLTPSRVKGCVLPQGKPINRSGSTSLIYATDDPEWLNVYTIERMKMEWWLRGIGIIDDYLAVGDAVYNGYTYGHFLGYSKYVSLKYPLYYAKTPFLKPLGTEHKRRLRKILKAIDAIDYQDHQEKWEKMQLITDEYPELRLPVEFVLDYDYPQIMPDFGWDDWRLVNGELTCIDPYHHAEISDIFRLWRTP